MNFVKGNYAMLLFSYKHLKVRESVPGGESVARNLQLSEKEYTYVLPTAVATSYNEEFNELQETLRSLGGTGIPFKYNLTLFFLLRLLCVVTAISGQVWLTFFLSTLQFISAPYSLFVALYAWVVWAVPMLLGAAITNCTVGPLVKWLNLSVGVPLTWPLVTVLMVVDMISCVYITARSAQAMSLLQWCKHVAYGGLNCKTYPLILLGLLVSCKFEICLTTMAIDGIFGISQKLSVLMQKYIAPWSILFYHQHRIGHLPHVYEHAHKFHHYLHGTTAFDAHLYGSGAPEEFFILWYEVIISLLFNTNPPSFSPFVIHLDWANKEAHVLHDKKELDCSNFHSYHHFAHRKNFGSIPPTCDMFFGTAYPSSDVYGYSGGWRITRTVDVSSGNTQFVYQKNGDLPLHTPPK